MTPLITRTIALFFAAAMLISNPVRADIAVVVHKDNPLSTITMKEGQRIFLGVTKKLPDGRSIKIVEQEDNFKLKENFYMELTGSSAAQVSSRWAGLVFSGQAIPPEKASGDKGVKEWLQKNPGGIGYIDSSRVDDSVKVVLTIRN
ncbi:MAG TPA: hypothetical protein VIM85_00105 [Pseudomonadales bacterium]